MLEYLIKVQFFPFMDYDWLIILWIRKMKSIARYFQGTSNYIIQPNESSRLIFFNSDMEFMLSSVRTFYNDLLMQTVTDFYMSYSVRGIGDYTMPLYFQLWKLRDICTGIVKEYAQTKLCACSF